MPLHCTSYGGTAIGLLGLRNGARSNNSGSSTLFLLRNAGDVDHSCKPSPLKPRDDPYGFGIVPLPVSPSKWGRLSTFKAFSSCLPWQRGGPARRTIGARKGEGTWKVCMTVVLPNLISFEIQACRKRMAQTNRFIVRRLSTAPPTEEFSLALPPPQRRRLV